MTITVNGEKEKINENISLYDFFKTKKIETKNIIVEHNAVIKKKELWQNIILENNDNLEVLKFVGGG